MFEDCVRALAAALLAFAVQGTWIALAFAVARLALRRADARLRYAAGVAALSAMPAVLLFTFFTMLRSGPVATAAASVGLPALPDHSGRVVLVWLVGEVLLGLRALGGWWYLRRLVAQASDEIPAAWSDAAARLAARMQLRRRVRLLCSERTSVPMVVGWLRPVVLFPSALMDRLRMRDIEALLAHELAHLARLDPLVFGLQRLVETLLFYHPAAWWVSARLSADRELCADDLAAARFGNRIDYARALAALELSRPQAPPTALAASGGSLVSRIRRLIGSDAPLSAPHATGVSALVAPFSLGAALALAVAWASLSTAAGDAVSIRWLPVEIARWSSIFERAGGAHGIDPDLLAIVALVESGGNERAESSRGAVGLMQVMPTTAQRIAEQRGMTFEPDALWEPELNVDLAAWYLARHMEEFGRGTGSASVDGRVSLVAAAYNGGERALRAHLAHGEPLSAETEQYRELVLRLWRERGRAESETLRSMRRSRPAR